MGSKVHRVEEATAALNSTQQSQPAHHHQPGLKPQPFSCTLSCSCALPSTPPCLLPSGNPSATVQTLRSLITVNKPVYSEDCDALLIRIDSRSPARKKKNQNTDHVFIILCVRNKSTLSRGPGILDRRLCSPPCHVETHGSSIIPPHRSPNKQSVCCCPGVLPGQQCSACRHSHAC